MIRVLIIDDEYLIRELIKNSINWEELGFKIVGEAKNGEEALKMIDEIYPDLIVVDINIPFINGLELCSIVHKNKSDIRMIILTGYCEFEYARKAIKYGVSEYILKPISPNEFSKVLLKVKQGILIERHKNKYIDELETEKQNNMNLLKQNFLLEIISGETYITYDEIYGIFKKYNLDLSYKSIVVIAIEIDFLDEKWTDEIERQLWKFAVLNISSEVFSEYFNSVTFCDDNEKIITIANIQEGEEHKSLTSYHVVSQKIKNYIARYFSFTITIGISGVYDGLMNISKCYKEALCALGVKFEQGADRIIKYSLDTPLQNKTSFSYFDRNDLILDLRLGARNSYLERIENIFNMMSKQRIGRDYVHVVAMDLVSTAILYTDEINIDIHQYDVIKKYNYLEIIKSKETMDELKNWIIEFYESICNADRNRTKTVKLVETAKKYIDEEYSRTNICLENIAKKVYVNPSYLSSIFKKEIGISLVEYLTRYRMEKAKKLMNSSPNKLVSDIASQVGYSDPYYFSKCFKKIHGVSPSQYINTIK